MWMAVWIWSYSVIVQLEANEWKWVQGDVTPWPEIRESEDSGMDYAKEIIANQVEEFHQVYWTWIRQGVIMLNQSGSFLWCHN